MIMIIPSNIPSYFFRADTPCIELVVFGLLLMVGVAALSQGWIFMCRDKRSEASQGYEHVF